MYILMADLLSRKKCEYATSFKYLVEAFALAHRSYLHGLADEALLKIAQLQVSAIMHRDTINVSLQNDLKCKNSDINERYSQRAQGI